MRLLYKNNIKPYKNIIVCLVMFALFGLSSCSRKHAYIKQVPEQFPYNYELIQKTLYGEMKQVEAPPPPPKKVSIDRDQYLRSKYAKLMRVPESTIDNTTLYSMIDQYLNAPRVAKGLSTSGVSVPDFISSYYQSYYNKSIPSVPFSVYQSPLFSIFKDQSYLQNGDIIFLKQDVNRAVSDMALYLENGYVLYNSDQTGLYLFELIDPYFQERFIAIGRLKDRN